MKAEIATKKGKKKLRASFHLLLFGSFLCWYLVLSGILMDLKMAPKGFEQLVLIVVTNPQTNLHTPVLSAFLTSKTKEVYQLLFSSIKILLDKYTFNIDFLKLRLIVILTKHYDYNPY